ncbi:hypothetical protein V6N13_027787 [Hibiscus sabdariffa]
MWGKGDERHMMDRVHLTTMMREMRKRLREWRVVMGLRMSRLSEESDVLERKKLVVETAAGWGDWEERLMRGVVVSEIKEGESGTGRGNGRGRMGIPVGEGGFWGEKR